LLKHLVSGIGVKENEVAELCDADKKIFYDMVENNFVIQIIDGFSAEAVQMMTGQNCVNGDSNKYVSFMLITDTDYTAQQCTAFETLYNYHVERLPANIINELSDINLLNRVSALEFETHKASYGQALGTNPVVIILSRPNVPLLRNINQLVHEKQPLFIGLIDGSFLIFLSIMPNQTACWECFEQRMLASVKDHVLYHKFLPIAPISYVNSVYNLHLTQLLHMGLQEVLTWSRFEISKFMGRVLFIYLPTFELHFHNINRISSCKTCGYLSKHINTELNVSLEHLMADYLKEMQNGV
jgi:streptolysin associated protein sagC